jgi:bifunctional DNA-binding transcriptional regulator/antitoxin component of YhaV-PrlF toxin-antitoxin module
MEEFVALIRKGGKVTVPKALRDRFNLSDGCYVHLAMLEVHRKGEDGVWVKQVLER